MSTPPALPPPSSLAGQPPSLLDPVAVQWIKDNEHLRLLSIFHYVAGGLAVLVSCFFILYIVFGVVMLTNMRAFDTMPRPTPPNAVGSPAPAASPTETAGPSAGPMSPRPARFQPTTHPAEPPAFIGYFLAGIGTVAVLIGWTVGALLILSGRHLARHTGRMFSLVIAGLSCLQVPFGTILGVFTLNVLSRPSVAALYAANARK